jgi:hypothetical protein
MEMAFVSQTVHLWFVTYQSGELVSSILLEIHSLYGSFPEFNTYQHYLFLESYLKQFPLF